MNLEAQVPGVFNRGLKKVDYMWNELRGSFPHITEKGKWLTNQNGHWTGGFWSGLLWLDFLNGHSISAEDITTQVEKLSVRMKDNKTHDMGFIFGPSCVFGNNIKQNDFFVKMAIAGAHNMADLFEERTGLIQAWDEKGYEGVSIVDTIMNIPVMIWAAQRTNEDHLRKKGLIAADHIRKNFIRADYSVFHMVRWDTRTFQIVERTTHQGYKPDTCWSRGQAWALYGFANMFRYTGNKTFLDTSEKLADYFWHHLDDELFLPRWDFYFKNNADEPLDASAASIASSGFLLLSDLMRRNSDSPAADKWKERAEKIIGSLIENCFYKDIDKYGIITRVTVDKPRNSGVNESSMYGDYYFMEALFRLMNYQNDALLDKLY